MDNKELLDWINNELAILGEEKFIQGLMAQHWQIHMGKFSRRVL